MGMLMFDMRRESCPGREVTHVAFSEVFHFLEVKIKHNGLNLGIQVEIRRNRRLMQSGLQISIVVIKNLNQVL